MSVPKPPKPSFNDPCQTSPLCSCTEKTKRWFDAPPLPVPGKDNYLQSGGTKFDPTKDLFSVGNYTMNMTSLWIAPEFRAGSAQPTKSAAFQKQIFYLVEAFLKVMTGQYWCVRNGYNPNPTIYISGPINCRSSDQNRLFKERVLKVAQSIKDQLKTFRKNLTQTVTIKYGNDTVSCTSEGKHIHILLSDDSLPGDWELLETVSPR